MTEASSSPTIETVLHEQRVFEPPAALAASARIGSMDAYRELVARCEADPEAFWGEQAREHLTTARTMYREMEMRFWLEQAEAESRALA